MTGVVQDNQDKNKKLKLAIIPVLVLILFYVIFQGSAENPIPDLSRFKRNKVEAQPKLEQVINRKEPELNKIKVKVLSFEEIANYDPFQSLILPKKQVTLPPDSLANSAEHSATLLKTKTEELKKSYSSAISGIIYSSKSRAVIINSKIYHEGDILDNGSKLVTIKPDGIVVENASKQF